MNLVLADVLKEHWAGYAAAHRTHLCTAHYRAVHRVLTCRTPELGGRVYQCSGCRKNHYSYHSCNHRNCPQCGAHDQQVWASQQEAKLLPVPYFMITFTLPSELRRACHKHPKTLYTLILRCSAHALKDITATQTQGGTTGFTSVLHTWGRQMQHHPHVHTIVPQVTWNREKEELIAAHKEEFLIHFRPLALRFRSLMQSALQTEHSDLYQTLSPAAKHSLSPRTLWNVQVKYVGTGKTAFRYLARYVQRSAFHPKRLLGYDGSGNIQLAWTCSNTGNRSVLHLHPHEFIRRWLNHVLPKGFTRVRH